MRITSGLGLLFLFVAGCTPPAPPKATMKPPEVLTTAAVRKPIIDFEDFTGHTEARSMIEIKSRVTGYLDKISFKDGDLVNEGDVLFEIDPRPYAVEVQRAKAVLNQAEVKAERMESDYLRAVVLRQSGAISAEDFGKAKADRGESESAIAVAKANLAKAKLDLDFTKIVVPTLDNGRKDDPLNPRIGRVGRRMKDPGNLVKADDTMLTTIVTLNPMYVYFDIDERTVLRLRALIQDKKIKTIREMTFRFELASDEGTYPYEGRVDFEDNKLDTGTGTLQLRGLFENKKGIAHGQFVRLRLFVGAERQAVLVPERAIGTDQGQKFVYVVYKETDKDGNESFKAEYRGGAAIELGALRDGWRVIEKGIEPGERIIWSGLQRVRKDATITPKDQSPISSR